MTVRDQSADVIELVGFDLPPWWSLDWPAIERHLGHRLPTDYKRLCEALPPGEFEAADEFILHPLGSDGGDQLLREGPRMRARLSELMDTWHGHDSPECADPDRLYPCLVTNNGDVCYWFASSDDPDAWTVVAWFHDGHSGLNDQGCSLSGVLYADIIRAFADYEEEPERFEGGPPRVFVPAF